MSVAFERRPRGRAPIGRVTTLLSVRRVDPANRLKTDLTERSGRYLTEALAVPLTMLVTAVSGIP